MSGITDPSEEYFKDGLWGWVTDQWKKLIGDDAGHLQVDVVESGLPAGAATSASQTTMITALQLIDDLRNALDSVATDELLTIFHSQDVDMEVKQTAAADLTPGIMGWDGSAWHKLPMIFGYSDRLAEEKANTDAAAGTVPLSFTAVPAGYVYVIELIDAYNVNTDPSLVQFQIRSASVVARAMSKSSPGINAVVIYSGTIILKETDFIRVRFEGCAAGDDLYAHIWGYKMKVAE